MARLTPGAQELLPGPTSLMTRLRPEWEGSKVPLLMLVLRRVVLEACSSRSGPLSVCRQSEGHSACCPGPARGSRVRPCSAQTPCYLPCYPQSLR